MNTLSFILAVVLPLLLLSLWQLGASSSLWSTYLLPTPTMVFEGLCELWVSGLLTKHILVSLKRVLLGFSAAVLTAIPLAMLISTNSYGRKLLRPVLEFCRHVPPLALLPLIILWLGIGEASKLAVVFMATFYPIFLNTLSGLIRTPSEFLEVGKQYHLTKWRIFLHIRLPYAAPAIFTGLRLGLGYSWRSLIGAEMIAASAGLGFLILDAELLARSDLVLSGIFIIGLCGMTLDYLFYRVSLLAFPQYLIPMKGKHHEIY